MQRTVLTLALIAAASTAVAQTTGTSTPSGPPAATPPANPTSSNYGTNTANAPGQSVAQAAIAQKRIEADGYKNVQGLALGPDGLWHGRALRGSTEVQVTVDRQGNVKQQE